MKLFLKNLAVLAVIMLGFVMYVEIAWGKKHEAPIPEVQASKDPSAG